MWHGIRPPQSMPHLVLGILTAVAGGGLTRPSPAAEIGNPTPEERSESQVPRESASSGGDAMPLRIPMELAVAAEVPSGNTKSLSLPAGELIPGSTRMLSLPGLGRIELRDLLGQAELHLQSAMAYRGGAGSFPAGRLPEIPPGVQEFHWFFRTEQSGLRLLGLGYRSYVSQPPDVFLAGIAGNPQGDALEPNPDLESLSEFLNRHAEESQSRRTELFAHQLEYQVLQLSYIDPDSALAMLRSFGVTTVGDSAGVQFPIAFSQLPVVVKLPDLSREDTTLLGEKENVGSNFGESVSLSNYSEFPLSPKTIPGSQLLVYYHPVYPEQFSRVRRYLDDVIDRSARQVFVEGMVLEISKEGLDELGIEWEFQSGGFEWMFGSLSAVAPDNSLFGSFNTRRNLDSEFSASIAALIREGKAEILSRPSVLTLNNRQASIRVGTDVPIATSQEGISGDSNKLVFNFRYLPIGILLNIRPRVTENGRAISMLIDIVVSDQVPGEDLVLTDGKRVLASAPTVSTRRVQTYAVIDNNTPFIIGGLVRKSNTTTTKKVPVLGNIPGLGKLFTAEEKQDRKQEVIIVLTPYVIPHERISQARPHLPKDEDEFDSFGNELFRDSYRIRAEDVFDLSFLRENPILNRYIRIFRAVRDLDFRLAEQEPFRRLNEYGLDAEYILVERMIYDVIKRLSRSDLPPADRLDSRIPLDRLIYFQEEETDGYAVRDLQETMRFLGNGTDAVGFFTAHPGKALVLSFVSNPESQTTEDPLRRGQAPSLILVDCRDEREWSKILWDWNQPGENGWPRHSVVLHSADDLLRLRRAVLLKKIIRLNGGRAELDLNRFAVGRMLRIPEVGPDQRHLVDAKVARYFFHTEHYYRALSQKIREIGQDLEAVQADPHIRAVLENARAESP